MATEKHTITADLLRRLPIGSVLVKDLALARPGRAPFRGIKMTESGWKTRNGNGPLYPGKNFRGEEAYYTDEAVVDSFSVLLDDDSVKHGEAHVFASDEDVPLRDYIDGTPASRDD